MPLLVMENYATRDAYWWLIIWEHAYFELSTCCLFLNWAHVYLANLFWIEHMLHIFVAYYWLIIWLWCPHWCPPQILSPSSGCDSLTEFGCPLLLQLLLLPQQLLLLYTPTTTTNTLYYLLQLLLHTTYYNSTTLTTLLVCWLLLLFLTTTLLLCTTLYYYYYLTMAACYSLFFAYILLVCWLLLYATPISTLYYFWHLHTSSIPLCCLLSYSCYSLLLLYYYS